VLGSLVPRDISNNLVGRGSGQHLCSSRLQVFGKDLFMRQVFSNRRFSIVFFSDSSISSPCSDGSKIEFL
jgi:hypothetical protein